MSHSLLRVPIVKLSVFCANCRTCAPTRDCNRQVIVTDIPQAWWQLGHYQLSAVKASTAVLSVVECASLLQHQTAIRRRHIYHEQPRQRRSSIASRKARAAEVCVQLSVVVHNQNIHTNQLQRSTTCTGKLSRSSCNPWVSMTRLNL